MSSRPLLQPMPVIVNGDMTTTLTSLVTVISNMSQMSYSYSWVGVAPIGSITVQVSDDYSQNVDGTVKNPGTWNTLPIAPPAGVSGNTGIGYVDIDQLGGYAVRTMYTPVSGTGSLQAIYKGKVT